MEEDINEALKKWHVTFIKAIKNVRSMKTERRLFRKYELHTPKGRLESDNEKKEEKKEK